MALAFEGASLQPGSTSAMLVARSTDGGRTWGATTSLIISGSTFFNDKNTITADPTDARYVYAVWDRLALAGGGPSMLARTTDAGATWEAAAVIYDPGPQSQTIGNQVVGAAQRDADQRLHAHRFRREQHDGRVDPLDPLDRPGRELVDPYQGGRSAGGRRARSGDELPIRDGSASAEIAVAPNGQLLVVWQDARFSGGAVDGIALSRSTDGGLTWSAPAQVNSARTVPAFTPSIHVRPDGTIGISYYDLRSNTADAATLPTDLMLARSLDGVSWNEVG